MGRQFGVAAIPFPSEQVADVNLDHRGGRRTHRVGKFGTCVRVGTRIQHHRIVWFGIADGRTEFSENVRLDIIHLSVRIIRPKLHEVILKGKMTVQVHFPGAQLAQVHTIDDEDPYVAFLAIHE